MLTDLVLLCFGLAFLTLGGEALIRGALSAAATLGISPLLSGLIIVGFGTSAPELVVSLSAALKSQPEIAIGNVVGSNIGNILFILGICAVITPLTVKPLILKRDAFTMVFATLLFLGLGSDTLFNIVDGVIFLMCLLGYLVWAYWSETFQGAPSGQLHTAQANEIENKKYSGWVTISLIIVGLGLLISGSRALIIGAVGIAHFYQIPESIVGLTVVALGTSLPEMTISIIAALRRHADVAVGNILGSNIFNILGILGITAVFTPTPLAPRVVSFDQWVMFIAALVLVVFLFTGRRLTRFEGAVLLAGYGGYLAFSIVS